MKRLIKLKHAFRLKRFLRYKEARELIMLILGLLAVLLFGTIGYELVEGWNFFDAFYMTVITTSRIGFGEVHPLSDAGRGFTVVLIVLAVSFVTLAVATLARRIVERELFLIVERSHMETLIHNLDQHIIICGFGRLGRIAAHDFRDEGVPVVVVEKSEEKAKEARDAGYPVIVGDATIDETLLQAGIEKAKALVSLLTKDSDNLYVVLTSRELSPSLFILSRTEDDFGEKRLRRAGANKTISPYREGGQKIANALMRPFVTDFIDRAVSGEGQLQIEEIRVPANSPLCGVTLQGINLRQKTNIIIAGIIAPTGETHVNPEGNTVIQARSTMIVLGERHQLDELEKIVRGEKKDN